MDAEESHAGAYDGITLRQMVCRLTCLSPDGQILILLDIQHDLQPVSHSALLAFPGCCLVAIKSVAFPISGVNLEEKDCYQEHHRKHDAGFDTLILVAHCSEGRDTEEKIKKPCLLGRVTEYYPQTSGL